MRNVLKTKMGFHGAKMPEVGHNEGQVMEYV